MDRGQLAILAGCVGLVFGSFANVLIARIPVGMSWVRGSSRCPRCGHDLAWYDNVPVLSWLWLRRRCRYCRGPISARYPLVEILTALVFAVVVAEHSVRFISVGLGHLAVVSVALVFIDIDVGRLPNALVMPSYPVVAALLAADAALEGDWWNLARAGIGLLALGGFYGLLWFAYPAGLGFGDVRTAGLLGLTAGYLGWASLAVGAIVGPLIGGVIVIVGLASGRLHRKSRIPYGPALIGGAWVGFLAGEAIASGYLSLLGSG